MKIKSVFIEIMHPNNDQVILTNAYFRDLSLWLIEEWYQKVSDKE